MWIVLPRPPLSPVAVLPAMAGLSLLLALTAGRYGYHRDELYFLVLHPAWGYVDQPPFLPWLARTVASVSDSLIVLRLPALLLTVGSVPVVASITRELGGARLAQSLAAWGYAFGTFTLVFGHLLLTASVDLLVWPLVVLLVLRALLRDPRWWWAAGLVVGLSTYNKWLITLLVLSLVGGLLIAGPRRMLVSRSLLGAAGLAVLVALPNIIWQLRHGLPQLAMGQALSAENAEDVRSSVLPLLLVMVGPLATPVWLVGLVALLRRPAWRPVRALAPALALVVLLTVLGGSQVYYPYGLLSAVFAVGCVPVAEAIRTTGRRWLAVVVVTLHVASGVAISSAALPLPLLVQTVVPDVNQTIGDQVGWPAYVAQVDRVTDAALAADPRTAVLTSNYGEAGALVVLGRHPDVPVVSGLNALWDQGGPPAGTTTVVVVGAALAAVQTEFARCTTVDRLSSGVDLDNEEEGQPVAVCTGPRRPWAELWPDLRHLG